MGRILSNRAVVAAKAETTEGTVIALAGGDANFQVMEPKFEADISMFKREILDTTLSPFKMIPGTRLGKISFKVENKGSGAAGTAPALGKLLIACGFSETVVASTSVTYAPTSTLANITSMTIALYKDGLKKMLKGARGNVKYSAKNGEPGMFEFEFTGVYDSVADIALLTPSGVETTVPVPLLSALFSVQSFSAFVSQISFDMLTKREPKGSFDPEDELVATHDWYGRWIAGTTGVLTWKHPGAAGNICTFSAPVCQYTKISESDRNGIAALGADFLMARSAAGGNDELSIAYT